MIILDTHIWVWWTDESPRLKSDDAAAIRLRQSGGLGISVFSLWEIAKLHEKNRIDFSIPLNEWFEKALTRPNISLLPISPKIIVESVNLPGDFHPDPADQIIVATARTYDVPLLTYDSKILEYEHVRFVE